MICTFVPQNFLSFQVFVFLRDRPNSKLRLIRDKMFFTLHLDKFLATKFHRSVTISHYQYLQQLASLHLLHVHRKAGAASFNSPNPSVSLLWIDFYFYFYFSRFLLHLCSHRKQGHRKKRSPSSILSQNKIKYMTLYYLITRRFFSAL